MKFMPFYQTFEDNINRLPEEEQLPAYKALTRYFFYGEEPSNLSFAASLIFDMAKPSLDKAKDRHDIAKKAAEEKWKKEAEKTEKRERRKALKS